MVVFLILVTANPLYAKWAWFENLKAEIKGELKGNAFTLSVYDNFGNNVTNVHGKKVCAKSVWVEVPGWTEDTVELSSVITNIVDGKEFVTVGNTVIYKEDGLKEVKNFQLPMELETMTGGVDTFWAKYMVRIANSLGTSKMVIISSQLGKPIAVFGGEDVYWEVADNLPKMTRLSIDGKALYIHRANFIIVDTALL